jgi:Cys-tRNA(Pro)/Cys-tRNA(Cys) deacylase
MEQWHSPATDFLDNLHIQYRIFHHLGVLTSLEQAARERNQQPDQVIRSILFRLPGDQFFMCLAAGSQQLSWKAIRQYLETSRLTLASDDEVIKVTGYRPGAVSPFGHLSAIRMLADSNVFQFPEISVGSGTRGTAIILRSADLAKAIPNLEIHRFI